MFRILTAAAAVLVAVPLVFAQGAGKPDTEAGRYILRRVDGGMMRVDRESGATSFCRKRERAWVCELVADDRAALEAEIARLRRDNAALAIEIGSLKERIARLEAGEPDAGAGTPQPDAGKRPRADLPTDEEIGRVMDTFEKMMRRFFDMVRDLREDFEQDRT